MVLKKLCLQNLDVAIQLNQQLKKLIIQNNSKQAINVIADILYVLGQTLLCINRVEFKQRILKSKTYRPPHIKSPKTTYQSISSSQKKLCLRLLSTATNNFIQAKTLIIQNRLEDAENIIAATISGRILLCVNNLR